MSKTWKRSSIDSRRNGVSRSPVPAALFAIWLAVAAAPTLAATFPAQQETGVGPAATAFQLLVGEPIVETNVFAVRRRARQLEKEAGYRYLADWVLPGGNHRGFRLAGDFTPTNPPPSGGKRPVNLGGSRVQAGGELVAPALDLVELATELRVLDELRARVEGLNVARDDGQQRRARAALLYLIDVARDDRRAAMSDFEQLFDLFRQSNHRLVRHRWPETLALSRGVRYAATREIVGEFLHLLNDMYNSDERSWRTSGEPRWHNYFFSLLGIHKFHQAGPSPRDRFAAAPRLKNWAPVSFATSRTRGEGQPRSHWQRTVGGVGKLSGHEIDYLMFKIPLRGDYQVECDATLYGWRDTQLLVAGTWVAPHWSKTSLETGTFGVTHPLRDLQPKLGDTEAFVRVRSVVRDGVCTTYYNGRRLHQQRLPAEPEPWLAVRSWSRHHGAVRNLRISGNPVIPEQVNLASSPELPGWTSYFEDAGGPTGDWRHDGDNGITGNVKPELAGTFQEGLLQYHRPMLEDGTIEYEFFYQPGRADVHPALDRLAFILEPAGAQIHWVTDGKFDRTGASPTNRIVEAEVRRGPAELPLKPGDWNRLRLTLRGDSVRLELNGQHICERVLEPTNQRTFGLFRYVDQSAMHVRNIVWHGEWPRELPAINEQQLAANMDFVDPPAPELQAVFEHDFASDGLPEKYFLMRGQDVRRRIRVKPDGVHVVRPSGEEWEEALIYARLRARGDFDVTAEFEQLETSAITQDASNPLAASISLLTALAGPREQHFKVIRREERNKRHVLSTIFATTQPNGSRRDFTGTRPYQAASGRFRIARRGDQVHFLFAEGDSPVFQLVAAETAATDDTDVDGIRLAAAARGTGRVSVVWKSLNIRAEQLMHWPRSQSPVLFVMNADGSALQQLTDPIGELGGHGSPDWSPDGKRVAFDTYKDSTADAHIFVVNADGSQPKDLGFGSMPTFSPDGRRIAFSWSGRGVAVMDADGRNREVLDRGGWGAQWSPDGKSIAYSGGNITLIDLSTRQQRNILEGDQARRYSYIAWNTAWSRDGRQICFKGRTRNGGAFEVAVADAAGSSHGFQVLHSGQPQPQNDFSWHPDGKRILCAMDDPRYGGPRLFTLDTENAVPPELLPVQQLDRDGTSPTWSPDGERIVFVSRPQRDWDDWSAAMKAGTQPSHQAATGQDNVSLKE